MAKAKEVLTRSDYSNYRNIRAISILFVLVGSVLAMGSAIGIIAGRQPGDEEISPVLMGLLGLVGLAGAVGGIAALRGSRRWSWLVYGMAAIYLFGFPLGTILSVVMFSGLSRYLDSVEQVNVGKHEFV